MLPPDGIPLYPRTSANQNVDRPIWQEIIAAPLVIIFIWGIYFVVFKAGALLLDFISRHFGDIVTQIAFVFAAIIFGTSLYVLRCRRLRLYSKMEFAVGLWGAVYAVNGLLPANKLSDFSAKPGVVIPFVGALYIIVRAFDNYYKSIQRDFSREEWNKRFFGTATKDRLA
jgi:hypothetical protein